MENMTAEFVSKLVEDLAKANGKNSALGKQVCDQEQRINELEQENAELVAHCEILTAQFNLDYNLQDRRIIDQTPKQSLTIIQADAIE